MSRQAVVQVCDASVVMPTVYQCLLTGCTQSNTDVMPGVPYRGAVRTAPGWGVPCRQQPPCMQRACLLQWARMPFCRPGQDQCKYLLQNDLCLLGTGNLSTGTRETGLNTRIYKCTHIHIQYTIHLKNIYIQLFISYSGKVKI